MEYYEKSKEIKINAFGENHYSLVTILNNIGNIYKLKGDQTKSDELFLKAKNVIIQSKILEQNVNNVVYARNFLIFMK